MTSQPTGRPWDQLWDLPEAICRKTFEKQIDRSWVSFVLIQRGDGARTKAPYPISDAVGEWRCMATTMATLLLRAIRVWINRPRPSSLFDMAFALGDCRARCDIVQPYASAAFIESSKPLLNDRSINNRYGGTISLPSTEVTANARR